MIPVAFFIWVMAKFAFSQNKIRTEFDQKS